MNTRNHKNCLKCKHGTTEACKKECMNHGMGRTLCDKNTCDGVPFEHTSHCIDCKQAIPNDVKNSTLQKCYSCGGKGTYSQMGGIHGSDDFGGEGFDEAPKIRNYPCSACNGTGYKPLQENGKCEHYSWEKIHNGLWQCRDCDFTSDTPAVSTSSTQKGCYCQGFLPKANYVHMANSCYPYPQDEDASTEDKTLSGAPLVEATAYEYLKTDLKLQEWQARLIAGKIGMCASNELSKAYARGRADEIKRNNDLE